MSESNTSPAPTAPTAPAALPVRKPLPPKPAPVNAGAAPQRSFLHAVNRGVREEPFRMIIHGVSGIGKTSFAACAPSPIFIDLERGSSHVDVARFPTPHSWTEVMAMVRELTSADHPYQTVVIDTLDALERLIWSHLLEESNNRWKSIEAYDGGYGRGWAAAAEQFQLLIDALDVLQQRRGMHVIMIAHSTFRKTKNAMGDDWERHALDVNEKSAGILRGWAEEVLFATAEVYTDRTRESRDGKQYQAKGTSTGRRLIYTSYNAAYDAKNRHGLPESIELNWETFFALAKSGDEAERARLTADVKELAASVAPDVAEKAMGMLGAPLQTLRALRDRMRSLAEGSNG